MNKLTVVQNGLTIPLKSNSEIKLKSPSIGQMSEKGVKELVLTLITSTFLKCGQKITPQESIVLINAFLEELKDFRYITVKELEICFKNGYKEAYGEYYGLNVKTFIGWIEKFIEKDRNEMLHAIKIDKPKKELSQEEKQEIINKGVIRCFEHFNETDLIDEGRIYVYDELFEKGFLPQEKEYKIKMYNEAKEVIKWELDNKKPHNREQHSEFKKLLNEIQKETSNTVILLAKKLILKSYFRKLRRDEALMDEFKKTFGECI